MHQKWCCGVREVLKTCGGQHNDHEHVEILGGMWRTSILNDKS